jgi:hypothetical protein
MGVKYLKYGVPEFEINNSSAYEDLNQSNHLFEVGAFKYMPAVSKGNGATKGWRRAREY